MYLTCDSNQAVIHTLFFFKLPSSTTSTLFPYTTLFRSPAGPGWVLRRQPPGRDRAHWLPRRSVRGDVPPTSCRRLPDRVRQDRKSTRLNSSHVRISYAVFCLKKKINNYNTT